MIWLDWFVRQRIEIVRASRPTSGGPMPRTMGGTEDATAAFAEEVRLRARWAMPEMSPSIGLFCVCLAPFMRGFLPPDLRGPASGSALGLVLTRATADLLADADPPPADPWHRRVFGEPPDGDGTDAVYVDVPHGALRLGADLQLRALLAVPWAEHPKAGEGGAARAERILVAIVATAMGSERQRGVLFAAVEADKVLAVALPDNTAVGFLQSGIAGTSGAEDRQAELHGLVLERAVRFLRLALAFHRYGPVDARAAVRATPAHVMAKRRNRPRQGESMFAMVRLSAPAGNLGRSPRDASAGWLLTARQEVSGHFRLQPYGPGGALRRLIWVDSYQRGPDNAPTKPPGFRL